LRTRKVAPEEGAVRYPELRDLKYKYGDFSRFRHAASGERILRSDRDEVFEGWRAHLSLLGELRAHARALQLP
jgi:hypothetical protein